MDKLENVVLEREVIYLNASYESQVLGILHKAFAKDPMFQYMFEGKNSSEYIRNFFDFIFHKSILLQELLIGVKEGDDLRGVASIETPNSINGVKFVLKPSFIYRGIKLFFQMPRHSFAFINQYMKVTISSRPKELHYYLVFMGVDDNHQGRGFGGELLRFVHDMVDKDASAKGIGLDTENPKNVKLYEGYGYRLVEKKVIGSITVYCMFRPRIEVDSSQ